MTASLADMSAENFTNSVALRAVHLLKATRTRIHLHSPNLLPGKILPVVFMSELHYGP